MCRRRRSIVARHIEGVAAVLLIEDESSHGSMPSRGFFAELTLRRLKRGVFRSVDDLKATINRLIADTNADPKPLVWTATVLAAVKRGKQALESVH